MSTFDHPDSESMSKKAAAAEEFCCAATPAALNHLRLVCNKLGVDPPEPKKGSGKDGAVMKIDWARKLVDFLFPDSSVEEKKG